MQPSGDTRPRTRAVWLALCGLFALVALMTIVRVRVTLADPNFDAQDARGLLKSDPGLLYYLVERVVDARGAVPDDWSADPRLEHPSTYDVPAHLPVAQEFVVAWLRLAIGDELPLHVFCLWIAGAFASLVLVGVWLLAFELSESAWWALCAALLAALLPATWRTMGFVLMDEDFSLPFFALHLGLLARAVRVRTTLAVLLSAVALAFALATWHASSFLFMLEALTLAILGVATGVNPFRSRAAWWFVVPLILVGVGVPFLRTSGFLTAIGCAVVFAFACEALAGERLAGRVGARARLLVTLFVFVAGSLLLAGSRGDHAHVLNLIAAKLTHLGVRPEDPLALTPEVRLMWQGPFDTLTASAAWSLLGPAFLVIPLAVWGALKLRAAPRVAATAWFACTTMFATWLVSRVVVVPAMLLPALCLPLLVAFTSSTRAKWIATALVLAQAFVFQSWIRDYVNPWYASPVQRRAEIRALVEALPGLVPLEEAIACDTMNATAILVHTRRAALLSPKWEARASRERVVEFMQSFFHATPEEFRQLLLEKYQCRYLLVDRFTLGYVSRYAAGIGTGEPAAGTIASRLLSTEEEVLRSVPGYLLLYRSSPRIMQSNGAPTDFFRLYALEDRQDRR